MDRTCVRKASGSRGRTQAPILRGPPRAGGGIGRRARLRALCPLGRGGSSPLRRTVREPPSSRGFSRFRGGTHQPAETQVYPAASREYATATGRATDRDRVANQRGTDATVRLRRPNTGRVRMRLAARWDCAGSTKRNRLRTVNVDSQPEALLRARLPTEHFLPMRPTTPVPTPHDSTTPNHRSMSGRTRQRWSGRGLGHDPANAQRQLGHASRTTEQTCVYPAGDVFDGTSARESGDAAKAGPRPCNDRTEHKRRSLRHRFRPTPCS
jgi:hypothetical protein